MAERNQSFDALLLHLRDGLSGYRILNVLTAEQGLLDVFVFGGAKSSLRSLATPFIFGKIFIYSDNVKNYKKLNDISILESFPGLRESYARLWSAEVIAEFIMRTSACGGEYPRVLSSSVEALRFLENADDKAAGLILSCFLWKMLSVMGLEPDFSGCSLCGQKFHTASSNQVWKADAALTPQARLASQAALAGQTPQARQSSPRLWYSDYEAAFVCPDCAVGHGESRHLIPVEDDLLTIFSIFSYNGFAGLPELAASLPAELLARVRHIVFGLAQNAAEGTLLTLKG